MGARVDDESRRGPDLTDREIEKLNQDVAAAFRHAKLLDEGATYDLSGALVAPPIIEEELSD